MFTLILRTNEIYLKLFFFYNSCKNFIDIGAIPSDDSVRVCPSIRSRRGWVWTKNPFNHAHWMIDISLRVTGRLKNGADGMVNMFVIVTTLYRTNVLWTLYMYYNSTVCMNSQCHYMLST